MSNTTSSLQYSNSFPVIALFLSISSLISVGSIALLFPKLANRTMSFWIQALSHVIFLVYPVTFLALHALIFQSVEDKIDDMEDKSAVALEMSGRIAWSLSSMLYVCTMLSLFIRLVRQATYQKMFIAFLLVLSGLVWIFQGIVSNLFLLARPDLDVENPSLSKAIDVYDQIWIFYIILCELSIATFAVRLLKRISVFLHQKSLDKQLPVNSLILHTHRQALFGSISRDLGIWIASALFWFALTVINMFNWGSNDETQVVVFNMVLALSTICIALQFLFGFRWINNLKKLMTSADSVRKNDKRGSEEIV